MRKPYLQFLYGSCTLIQIQSYLFIISQPKLLKLASCSQFLRRIPTLHGIYFYIPLFFIQSHILRPQMGSTTFNDRIFETVLLGLSNVLITKKLCPVLPVEGNMTFAFWSLLSLSKMTTSVFLTLTSYILEL